MAVAYINERLRQKNASGEYDIMHLESESGLILRSGTTAGTFKTGTVEDALTTLENDSSTLKDRNVNLTGDVTGTGALDTSTNSINISTTIVDDSHNHTGSTITISGTTAGNFLTTDEHGNPVAGTSKASDFAATGHGHALTDTTITGTLAVAHGGTGLETLTSGSFLKGNGTSAVTLRTPAEVLSDIGAAANSHTHGNITNEGKLSSDVAHASGDKLVLADSSDGAVQRSDIALGSDTTKFLNNSGAWAVPPGTYVHPSYDIATAAAKKVGRDATGHVVLGDAITAGDIGAATDDHTHNYAGSESVGGAANSVKASLTVGNKTFNGSATVTITAADLGLSSAMSFIGVTTTVLTDGATTNPITIDSAPVTAQKGNVALYGGLEFLWTGSKWQQLGDESSYALKSHTHGNINNDGTITSDTAAAAGDKIVMVDASDNKVQRSGIAIGTGTTTYLRNDGTWGTPAGTYTHPSYTAITEGFRKVGNDATGHVISTTAVAASDVKGLSGIDMTAASASAAGTHGMVPAPGAGAQTKFLRGDATWQTVITSETTLSKGADTTGTDGITFVQDVGVNNHQITLTKASIPSASGTVNGLMSSNDFTKLSGIEANANNYSHPTTTAATASAVKIGRDTSGHVVIGDAITCGDIGAATDSHVHGNITNGGAITAAGVTIASGDAIVITDSSASGKLVKTSITFDGTTATQALTKAGTWQTFNNYSHPAYTAATAAAIKVGRDSSGHVVTGDALVFSDIVSGGVLSVANGGTGKSTVTVGNYLVGNGTSALNEKTPAQVLSDIGAAASSHTHGLNSNDITGTLPISKGGTGATTAAGARAELGVINIQTSPTNNPPTNQVAGDLWYETLT